MFQVLINYHALWIKGFVTTLELIGAIMAIGIPLGIVLGVVGGKFNTELGTIIKGARFVTKVIPVLVLLFWFHYPLQSMFHIVVNPFWTTIVALGIINMISTAFVISTELQLLPKSYREAGVTLGMTSIQIVRHVELPLLVRRTLPQLLLNQAAMLEYTLFASLISVPELFRVAQTINAMAYKPVVIYSLLVLFFLMILGPLHIVINRIQKKYVAEYA
jgi:ABC-type amino acid transport system permease subunit